MEVSMKNLLLQMESNSIRDSCIRFYGRVQIRKGKEEKKRRERETETEELGLREENCYQTSTQEMVKEPHLQTQSNSRLRGRRQEQEGLCFHQH